MAVSAHGTQIFRNGVAIDELGDVTPPPLTRTVTDVTRWEEDDERTASGRRKVGALVFDLNWVEAKHSVLIAAWVTGVQDAYEIVFADGSTWFFDGFIDALVIKTPSDGKLAVTVTVITTGGVTFSADILLLETGGALLLEDGNSIAL